MNGKIVRSCILLDAVEWFQNILKLTAIIVVSANWFQL